MATTVVFKYTTSGVFTVPTGTTSWFVEMWGSSGGGGGGGLAAGSGGGSGSYSRNTTAFVTTTGTVTVAIGAGGAFGAASTAGGAGVATTVANATGTPLTVIPVVNPGGGGGGNGGAGGARGAAGAVAGTTNTAGATGTVGAGTGGAGGAGVNTAAGTGFVGGIGGAGGTGGAASTAGLIGNSGIVIFTVTGNFEHYDEQLDAFTFDQDYAVADDETTQLVIQSSMDAVGPNFVAPKTQPPEDVIFHDWWDTVDDPTIIDSEWSGPVQPQAPPVPNPVEDSWNWNETDEEDLWWVDQEIRVSVIQPRILEDAWDWNESVEDEWGIDQEQQPSAPIVVTPRQSPEDAWDWSTDSNDSDDFWGVDQEIGPSATQNLRLTLEDPWDWDVDFTDDWESFLVNPITKSFLDGLFPGPTLTFTTLSGFPDTYFPIGAIYAFCTVTGGGGGGALNSTAFAGGGSGGSTTTGYLPSTGLGIEYIFGSLSNGGDSAITYPGNGFPGSTNSFLTYSDTLGTLYPNVLIGRPGNGGTAGASITPAQGAITLVTDIDTTVVVGGAYYNGRNGGVGSASEGGDGGDGGYYPDSGGEQGVVPPTNVAQRAYVSGSAGAAGGGGGGIVDPTFITGTGGYGADGIITVTFYYRYDPQTFVTRADAWDWEQSDEEDLWWIDEFQNINATRNGLLNLEDGWDWAGDTDDSEDFWMEEQQGVGPNGAAASGLLNVEDPWNWDESDEEDLWWVDEPIGANFYQPPEDAWNWDESDEEDLWWIDELLPASVYQPVEDGWDWSTDADDSEDFWWIDEPIGPNYPPAIVEDAWDWSADSDDSEDFWWIDEPIGPSLRNKALTVEDPWNWDETDEEDLWWIDEPIGKNYPPALVEDAWDWSADNDDSEDFWWVDEPIGANFYQPPEDAWNWSADNDDSEDFWMEEQQGVGPNAPPPGPQLPQPDAWYWDEETVEDNWDSLLEYGIVGTALLFPVNTLSVAPPAQTTTVASIGTVTVTSSSIQNVVVLVAGLTAYARISQVNVWGNIDDNQNPNWVPVDENTPTPTPPNWTPVDETSPTPSTWVPVDETSPTPPTWSPVDTTSPAPNWKLTKD